MKQAKLIIPMDVAKLLGVESEYKKNLIKEELKTTYDDYMNNGFESEKNKNVFNDVNNEEIFK